MTDLLEPGVIDPAEPHIEPDAVELVERAEGGGDGRTLVIRLVKWGEVAEHTHEGIRETFERGAFAGTDPTRVTIEAQGHGHEIVGRGVSLEEREDGAYLTARVASTSGGNDLLTLIREGLLGAASVVFRPIQSVAAPGGLVRRTLVELARVAVLDRGAYPSAAVVAVRSEQEAVMADAIAEPVTAEPVTDPIAEPAQEPAPTPTPEPLVERAAPQEAIVTAPTAPAPEPVDLSPLMSRVEAVEQRMAILAAAPVATPPMPELYQLRSFGDYIERARDERALVAGGHPDRDGLRYAMADFIQRTIADQITGNNAGVIPPAWLGTVKRIVDLGRPAINALGGAQPLPPAGMELDWPYVSSSNVIIGVQASQKSEVTSARVDIGKDTSAIGTYAGASDISVQLLKRSAPSYREAYDRIMLAYWAKVTDAAFAAALLSAGTAATYGWDADTTGKNLKGAVFAASVQVEEATGLPADAVLCATDVFQQLGFLSEIVPPTPAGNPSNASGTAHAGTLDVNVAGLRFVHARGLTTGNVIVTNQQAAQWFEDGPFSMTADDATLLGTDVAWYSFGATATFVPAGIVKLFGPGASGS